MPRKRNNTICTATPASVLRSKVSKRKYCTPRRAVRKSMGSTLVGGPFEGHKLCMVNHITLPIQVGQWRGFYQGYQWIEYTA